MNAHFDCLRRFGWDEFFQTNFQPYLNGGYIAGRISLEQKDIYRIFTGEGELLAQVSGKLRYEALSRGDFPAAGDWVVVQPQPKEGKATIHAILPRKSRFVRKMAGGRTEEQIIGANIDTVFQVTSLNQNYNLRRIERYLVVAWESGATPVVVLSKADLCRDADEKLKEVQAVAPGVPVHIISVIEGKGLDALDQYLLSGRTVALLGSSGVGKSTLINYLAGCEVQRVREVRDSDDRGRHTTSHRQLLLLPRGGLILDTPGLRELQLWDGQSGVEVTFAEIEELARRCYFRDCQHGDERGCAVRAALEEEKIDPLRYQNYQKLQKERRHLALKQDQVAQIAEKRRWKKLSRMASRRADTKRGGQGFF